MDPFIGEIRPLPFVFAPLGWLYCDGRLVSISDYEVLFNLIGTTYGGDGQTTFGLPDLRGRVPMGAGSGGGTTTVLGQLGGVESVALSASQIPAHTHALTTSGSGTSSTPVGNRPGLSSSSVYGVANGSLAADSVSPSTGGGSPHDNVQPCLTIAFCIAYQGIFPSQS